MAQRKSTRKPKSPPSRVATAGPGNGLRNSLAYSVLIAFTLIAFANAWPNNLVFDDRIFADSARFSGLGLGDLVRFFTEDLWAASGEDSSLYRPLLLLLITGQSLLFGDWMAGYHLVNIGLHICATLLVYGFISRLLQLCGHPKGQARQFSLLAALLFGVHPIHTEVVNSIFNGSEILVTIGVVGGLSWFLKHQNRQPLKAWAGLNLIFLLILFCRESAAALPLLLVALIWLTRTDSWKLRLRACVPVISLLLPLGIYLALRSQALGGGDTGMPGEAPVETLEPLAEYGMDFSLAKLAPAVVFWFEGLKNLLWPHPLQIYYDPPQPSIWLALAAQVAIVVAAVVAWFRKQPLPLIALAFFYLSILPSSRIISEPGVQAVLFDRALYLPSVGLVIACAWGLGVLARKTSFNTAVVTTLVITLVMIPLCLMRNADWADEIRLFEADYRKLETKDSIIGSMLAAHLRANNLSRAAELCDENRALIRAGHTMGAHCGSVYSRAGRFRDAEQAYLAVKSPSIRVFADFNLGLMYLQLGRRAEAEERVAMAIAAEPKPFLKRYFEAVALIQLHPGNRDRLLEAQALLQQALELQPQHTDSRLELEALNRTLSGAPPVR